MSTKSKALVLRAIKHKEISDQPLKFKSMSAVERYLGKNRGYVFKKIKEAGKGCPVVESTTGRKFVVYECGGKILYSRLGLLHYLAEQAIQKEEHKQNKRAEAKTEPLIKPRKLTAERLHTRHEIHKRMKDLLDKINAKYHGITKQCVEDMPPELLELRRLVNMKSKERIGNTR